MRCVGKMGNQQNKNVDILVGKQENVVEGVHVLPCCMSCAQTVLVRIDGTPTILIFGSSWNSNIYKYENKLESYTVYDKYKQKIHSLH